jgi:hypothetical protein
MVIIRIFASFVFLSGLHTVAWAQQNSSITGSVDGPPLVVFDSRYDSCGGGDYPDAPARAFRTKNGDVNLLAVHHINRRMIGRSLETVAHSCQIIFQGGRIKRPDTYDDYAWIAGTHTIDGKIIYALVHNEFHGNERPDLCPSGIYLHCWENSLTLAISRDGGRSFKRARENGGLVAALPSPYRGDQGKPIGYFNPTNIIKHQDYYYAMFSMITRNPDTSGICLMRTNILEDPSSWRGWDGGEFTVAFINPYNLSGGEFSECKPIAKSKLFFSLGSVQWHPESKSFVLIMRFQKWDKPRHNEVPGIYISTSPDLIRWSDPFLLLADKSASQDGRAQLYPAFLDPESSDQNFQLIGNNPLLYTIDIDQQSAGSPRRLLSRSVVLKAKNK